MARARILTLPALLVLLHAAPAAATPSQGLAGVRAQVDDLDDLGDLGDLGGDDFGDLGGDDFGDDFGDFGDDDLGGDDFGGGLDDVPGGDPLDLGDDPFAAGPDEDPLGLPALDDDPFAVDPSEPDPFAIPGLDEPTTPLPDGSAHDYLSAFADLLDELETRGVKRPFHELSLRRLEEWIVPHAGDPGAGDDPLLRLDGLLEAARDGAPELPLGEPERLVALRGGETSEELPGLASGPTPDPFASDDPFDVGLDFDDPELDDEGLDPPDFDDPELDISLPEFEPGTRARQVGPADPFRIFRLRRQVAAAVLRPLDGAGWTRWLAKAGDEVAAIREGLGEAVGTAQGRRALEAALASGVPEVAASLLVEVLGEQGTLEDGRLLDLVARRHPELSSDVARARGRLDERSQRYRGLDRAGREAAARQLLEQAAAMARSEDWPRAVALATEAASLVPASPVVRYRQARYAYQLGWYQRSREALEAALQAGSRDPALVTTYTKVLRRQGDDETLVRFLEASFDQGGPTELKVKICNELALEYTVRGDGAEAARIARIGLGYFVPPAVRDNLLTRYAEGLTLQGRYAEAEEAYTQALALDPSYRKAQLGLAAVRRLRGADVTLAGGF